jgi:maltooligosyltrehalose trehalohydrolase
VVDPDAYRWRDARWRSPDVRDLVVYELHVGTFSAEGTFSGVGRHLDALRQLGVTAIELMPIAECPGSRNWGYDGVALFAPSHNYGHPDDLRALVDAAHAAGLAVVLDVVYNHLGPEGAYLPQFYSRYMTGSHSTPWGSAVNLDGPGSAMVREFIVDNAIHWIREYHIDALRLDATHALIDQSPTHIAAELGDRVREAAGRPIPIHAEDDRNLAAIVEPRDAGGWGLDGIWADDFHHVLRRQLAGDEHGYFCDFGGSARELAATIRHGWLFTGQHSQHARSPRGTDASHVPMRKFVVCLQNHDQIGNRATGDRLNHVIDPAAWRAASVVLLTAPMTPLLFMGQEWAASTPFLYFTDLEPDLGALVTEGRRAEFKDFPGFNDPVRRVQIPDPQACATFEASRLNWDERTYGSHAASLTLYTALLELRRTHAALRASDSPLGDAVAPDDDALIVRREENGERIYVVVRLRGSGPVTVDDARARSSELVLSTEEDRFTLDPVPPAIESADGRITVSFERPGAVILKIA